MNFLHFYNFFNLETTQVSITDDGVSVSARSEKANLPTINALACLIHFFVQLQDCAGQRRYLLLFDVHETQVSS